MSLKVTRCHICNSEIEYTDEGLYVLTNCRRYGAPFKGIRSIRGTGRTTEILLDAMAVLEIGYYVLIVDEPLALQARVMASSLGLDKYRIFSNPEDLENKFGIGTVTISDHPKR